MPIETPDTTIEVPETNLSILNAFGIAGAASVAFYGGRKLIRYRRARKMEKDVERILRVVEAFEAENAA